LKKIKVLKFGLVIKILNKTFMMIQKEIQDECRNRAILEIESILPYVEKVNGHLYSISASLRPNPNDNDKYSYWVYEIKTQLDFVASALTDENGKRFGGICKDGHIFTLLNLYKDSLQIPTKSIQEKMVLELLIEVCTEIIIDNGDGLNNRRNDHYALFNTRKFINHLVEEHTLNNTRREKNIWFELRG
jgi:hypothetical protein